MATENQPYVCLAKKLRKIYPARKPWDASDLGGWFWRADGSWVKELQLLLQGRFSETEKQTCGKPSAVLKQNWSLGLCQPEATEPWGNIVMHLFSLK